MPMPRRLLPLLSGVLHRVQGLARRLWEGLLVFLEVIGLRPEKPPDPALQLARFKLYHAEFRKLLAANNSFLEITAELGQKRLEGGPIDRAYVQRKAVRAVTDIHTMVESVNAISTGRYPGVREAFDRIASELTSVLQTESPSESAELVLEMPTIHAGHADLVGGKMANLGELRNRLQLPVPDGFAVTTEGFRLALEEGGIWSWIQSEHLDLLSADDLETWSRNLREQIRGLPIPRLLEREILLAYDRMAARIGGEPRLAVRSSALGEDGDLSFAGQFLTILNVSREGLLDAYRQVLASLFSPEAVHYRLLHGVPGESAEMAVGVVAMIEAVASGVIFSRDPSRPDADEVLIQAIRGLGVALAEGSAFPEEIRVPRGDGPGRLVRTPAAQAARIVSSRGAGLQEAVLDPEEAALPCITDEESALLARWAVRLESHFHGPQDVEWAMGADRKIVLLQARPLRLAARGRARAERPLPGFRLLLEGGETACPGVGAGRAVHMDENDPMDSFPQGGVLVARRSSPRFVRVLSRAGAVVTDAGSTTGHMASLARELRVPALLNTRTATRSIPEGSLVTVDATSGFVYEGEIPALAALGESTVPDSPPPSPLQARGRTPAGDLLEQILERISPLNLADPRSASFTPERCRTLHDLARYIHERSYAEMFGMGGKLGDARSSSFQLDVFLPIDLYIIDLGGGLEQGVSGRKVKPSQIVSVPLSAFLRGMLNERIPRFGPRPMDVGGFFSVMMRHATTNPEQDATFSDPCYALISDSYLNYTARVGYHFSVVDAYCSSSANKNYINLLFRGGAADGVRRNRRVRAIAGVLGRKGFSVDVRQDTVTARLNKASAEESTASLEMIGAAFQFFRQMDVAMVDEESVRLFEEAFISGDYELKEVKGEGSELKA
ncbi:MAG: PEP/pyruvate-binding domain-containing protein [bacterium]